MNGAVTARLLVIALLSICTMALVPVLVKSTTANEITIALSRLAIALLVISPYVAYKGALSGLSGREWRGLAILGAVFGLHWLSYFLSIKMATAALAAIAVSTYGIQLLLLNVVINRQKFSGADWIATGLCFAGALLVVPRFSLDDSVTVGLLWGLLSGLLYACLPLLHQRILRVSTLGRTWGQFFFAAVLILPLVGYSHWDLSDRDWGLLLVLGLVCTVVAHSLWVKASSELPAVITGVVYYLYVPIAMVLSMLFLGEQANTGMIVGAGLIIIANVGHAVRAWRQRSPAMDQ